MVYPTKKINFSTVCRRAGSALALIALAGGLTGCESDSFIDPGEVGRMEQTPTIVPVLDRIAQVEGGDAANPTPYSPITPEDLQVEAESYRMGPGDGIMVKIQDFYEDRVPAEFERILDDRGFIDLPKLGPVFVSGQTGDEAGQTISRALKTRRVLNDPIVDVNAVQRRSQTYNIIGGVYTPGMYTIPRPDFRLLDALGNGGRFSENVPWVYVIRTVSLANPSAKSPGTAPTAPAAATPATAAPATPAAAPAGGKKESVIDLIDSIAKPEDKKPAPGNPGDFGQPSGTAAAPAQPMPVIDIDATSKAAAPAQPAGSSEWQFVNGQWVKGTAGKAAPSDPSAGVLTQRVLQIPMGPLMNGAAQYNVVIRPGDTVRVHSLSEGIVYVHGNVNRPGVYNVPQTGKMTIIRAIAAASDLNDIAIPERVDITRYIGNDRQATVRVNYRAIVEGTQPDITLRDGDVINVGTNFWAFPLSVIRQGFRANYGFSFTLDRNFGYDIFGPQKTNATGF